jgi:hypothetical protein
MPDWLSHILIALIFAELLNIDKKSLIVLGSLLPDFIVKMYFFAVFFPVNDSLLFMLTLYDTPVMGLILPALVAPLFKYNWKKTYLYIALGFMLHILADSLTRGFSSSIFFYPLSYRYFSFNIFWAEQYWIILAISLITYISIKFIKNKISIKNFI